MTNSFPVAQERPCARCIKRNIGHLCHDEPREPESASKKSKAQQQQTTSTTEEDGSPPDQLQGSTDAVLNTSFQEAQEPQQESELNLGAPALSQGGPLQIAQPAPVSGSQANALNSSSNQCEKLARTTL
jgi:hypothetical protein